MTEETTAPDAKSHEIHKWGGTPRYNVVRWLGSGGMGVVYEVFDREAQRSVALKRLLKTTPEFVYRFKQEFRTLADVQHPNLVHLYEFVADEANEVFLTMELVRGTDFLDYVRPCDGVAAFDRLRSALRQLVDGVLALHAAGKLHRDIKPSNVLVTAEGRVVLLDFGVAAAIQPSDPAAIDEGEIVGTPSYMAPEQAWSLVPRPASDWYSVGAMLYAALVGSPPFVGPAIDIISRKNLVDPVPPRERQPGIPTDLDALCMSLLAREPQMRPTGTVILRHLGASSDARHPAPARTSAAQTTLIGREAHLLDLARALEATCAGHPVALLAAGRSGMGKSALMGQFLDERVMRGDAIVLRGRAYERESVPFKAVDAVIDALSLHLLRAEKLGESVRLPEDVSVLAKVFPVLGRVPGVKDPSRENVPDPLGVRRRAFSALRDLLAATAAGQRLIVYVDDVQWGDMDSATLLLELLRPPCDLPLLLLMTYRDDEAQSSDFLRETRARLPGRADVRELDIGPLSQEEAERLAFTLLGSDERTRPLAASIGRESGGNPFLIEELVNSVSGSSRTQMLAARADLSAATLEQMVTERVRDLSEDARRLLEMIAIEGRPVPTSIIGPAARVTDRTDELIGLLRSRRFVRAGLRDGREVVEMSHDRIRETVAAQISPLATREHHGRLAQVLESTPGADPERIAVHLLGAGDAERGARFAEVAAENAASKLAFQRAAQLFRMAAATAPASSPEGRRLRQRLAEVLEWAGRGMDAARVYDELARAAPADERTAFERAAAEHLLTCGRIDEGTAALRRVLSEVSLVAPRSAVSALVRFLVYRLWLRLRGLGFRPREASELSERERLRLDALYTVALSFGSVDVVLSACMTAWYLLSALRAGERASIQRAATLQMSLTAADGGTKSKQDIELERTAERLLGAEPNPEALAFFRANIGVSHYCRGNWAAAVRALDLALEHYPASRAGMTSNVNVFCVCSLVYAGRIRELRRRLPRLIAEAEDRGDLFLMAHMRSSHPIVAWLAADDPDDARRHSREGMARWPRTRFFIQHWQAMLADAQIELYSGDGAKAYERIAAEMPALRRSLLMHAQIIRGITLFVRGRAAVASIESAPALRAARLSDAARQARRLAREGVPWTSLFSSMLSAAIANARGDRDGAVSRLRLSIERASPADMSMHGAAAKRQLGQLIGGDEGATFVVEADAAMAKEDIRAPDRWAAMLLPGTWEG